MSSRAVIEAAIDAYEEAIRRASDAQRAVAGRVPFEPVRVDPAHLRRPDPRHRRRAAVRRALVVGRVSGLFWESTGEGPPVLMIMGLGLSGGAWWRTVPVLSQRLRVITYRQPRRRPLAVARSTATPRRRWPTTRSPCSTPPASSARTCTASRSAEWWRSSSCCATPTGSARWCSARPTPGARAPSAPEPEVLEFFARRPGMKPEEAARASVPFNYGPRCRSEYPGADRGGHPAAARAPVPGAGLPRAAAGRDDAQLPPAAEAHRGARRSSSTVATTA